MKKKILNIVIATTCCILFQGRTNAQNNADIVYYFIDTDIKLTASTGADATKGIYASSPIRTARWEEHETLISQFKMKLTKMYPQQPGVVSRVVFRWQTSMNDAKESYAIKEAKMKKENYTMVQVQ